MKLSDSDVAYLIRRIKDMQRIIDSNNSRVQAGLFRSVARQEAAIQILNLAGWVWDWDVMDAYKRTQKEKREYFDASTTDRT